MLQRFYITKKMPRVTATVQKMRFLGSNASFSLMLLRGQCSHF